MTTNTDALISRLIDEWYFHSDIHDKAKLLRFGRELLSASKPVVPQDERTAFDAWASNFTKFPEKYDNIPAWLAWQARAMLAAPPAAPAQSVEIAKEQAPRLIGYDECRCILTQYCDGTCRPIFEKAAPHPAQTALTRDSVQQKAITHGFQYWRASDAHGVTATNAQAVELLQDLLGVEVEIEAQTGQTLTDAARDVLEERRRQVEAEGWTSEHDDEHDPGVLASAAMSYTSFAADLLYPMSLGDGFRDLEGKPPMWWPWDASWWKPTTPRRALEKAAALILAEIERLDRAAQPSSEGDQ